MSEPPTKSQSEKGSDPLPSPGHPHQTEQKTRDSAGGLTPFRTDSNLEGFAYAEQIQGVPPRSLGFGLLLPAEREPWMSEVETLARRLQATHYPEGWPSCRLFCSILLENGRRLVAAVSYGLTDHTSSHRRGGVEMIGIVAPGNLGAATALSIYRWLCKRRVETGGIHFLAGNHSLHQILAESPPSEGTDAGGPAGRATSSKALPLLCAANTAADPDSAVTLLLERAGDAWQWLPLVGADFPLASYAQHGLLVAWSPPVAVTATTRPPVIPQTPFHRTRKISPAVAGLLGLLAISVVANVVQFALRPGSHSAEPGPADNSLALPRQSGGAERPSHGGSQPAQFVQGLHSLVQREGVLREWSTDRLVAQYQQELALNHDLHSNIVEGKVVVGAVSLLSQRSTSRLEAMLRDVLTDEAILREVSRKLQERLSGERPSSR